MKKFAVVICLVLLIGACTTISARTITVLASEDTYMASSGPNTNYDEESQGIISGRWSSYDVSSLIRFDLPSLNPGEVVESATLRLYAYEVVHEGTYHINREKRNWTEADATWNKYDGTNSWQIPGSKGQEDIDQTPSDSVTISESDENSWIEWDITDLVKGWYSSSYPNCGMLLQNYDGDIWDIAKFRASDGSSPNGGEYSPQLVITVVPEPATVGFLSLGLLGFIRKR